MAAEKRTVLSEVRELFAEIRLAYLNWRLRGRARPISGMDAAASETLTPEASEITFTPVTPEADDGRQTDHGDKAVADSAPADIVCPVTRQRLNRAIKMYQCRQCSIYYSMEGWEFLRQTARGQCCGCRGVNTVLPVVSVR